MNSNSQKNVKLVEGDYKTFEFRRIQSCDYEKVLKHINDYYMKDEVTNIALGVNKQYEDEMREICRIVLDFNMSFLAEDKTSGEVAGVRLLFRNQKDVDIFSNLEINSSQLKILLFLIGKLNEEAKIFETYGITEFAELFLASTAPKYRNQGLSKEFYRRSLAYFKAEGFKLAKVCVSSPWTKAATKSLNFKQLAEIDYETVRNDEGELIFDPERVKGLSIAVKVYPLGN